MVNHRVLPGDSVASVLAHDRARSPIRGCSCARCPTTTTEPAGINFGERRISPAALVIRAEFPHAAVAPGLVLGATDGRHYEVVTSNVLRFAPITMSKDDLARFHGNDKRVAITDYMRAIGFYERLITRTQCVAVTR